MDKVQLSAWQTNSLLNTLSVVASRLAELSVSFRTGLVAVVIVVSGIGLAGVMLYVRHARHARHQAKEREIREWGAFAKGTAQTDLLQY